VSVHFSIWFENFLNLFYPRLCNGCGRPLFTGEEIICTRCLFKLPQTNFHLHKDNPVSRIFWGRVPLQSATSFLFFNKGGIVQNLIHRLKYRNSPQVGVYLGRQFGFQLMDSPVFKDVDFIIPVPLHPKKEHIRGYNQSEMIALGLEESMKAVAVTDNLIRRVHTSSQTKKSRYGRWENVKGIFEVKNPEQLEGKHLLLVDDVITTGATLEACCQTLLEIPGVKISVASLAYAQG
jgi:ComF family protein